MGTIKYDECTFRFMCDRARDDGEYYLEVCDSRGKSWKQIPLLDIESIEPTNGKDFNLNYYMSSSFFGRSEYLKTEVY